MDNVQPRLDGRNYNKKIKMATVTSPRIPEVGDRISIKFSAKKDCVWGKYWYDGVVINATQSDGDGIYDIQVYYFIDKKVCTSRINMNEYQKSWMFKWLNWRTAKMAVTQKKRYVDFLTSHSTHPM